VAERTGGSVDRAGGSWITGPSPSEGSAARARAPLRRGRRGASTRAVSTRVPDPARA